MKYNLFLFWIFFSFVSSAIDNEEGSSESETTINDNVANPDSISRKRSRDQFAASSNRINLPHSRVEFNPVYPSVVRPRPLLGSESRAHHQSILESLKMNNQQPSTPIASGSLDHKGPPNSITKLEIFLNENPEIETFSKKDLPSKMKLFLDTYPQKEEILKTSHAASQVLRRDRKKVERIFEREDARLADIIRVMENRFYRYASNTNPPRESLRPNDISSLAQMIAIEGSTRLVANLPRKLQESLNSLPQSSHSVNFICRFQFKPASILSCSYSFIIQCTNRVQMMQFVFCEKPTEISIGVTDEITKDGLQYIFERRSLNLMHTLNVVDPKLMHRLKVVDPAVVSKNSYDFTPFAQMIALEGSHTLEAVRKNIPTRIQASLNNLPQRSSNVGNYKCPFVPVTEYMRKLCSDSFKIECSNQFHIIQFAYCRKPTEILVWVIDGAAIKYIFDRSSYKLLQTVQVIDTSV